MPYKTGLMNKINYTIKYITTPEYDGNIGRAALQEP